VTNLHNDWNQHKIKKNEFRKSNELLKTQEDVVKEGSEFFKVQLSPVLEPVVNPIDVGSHSSKGNNQHISEGRPKVITSKGPWSIECLQNHEPIVFSAVRKDVSNIKDVLATSPSQTSLALPKKKKVGSFKHLVRLMKGVACMPDSERKQIIQTLKKHKRSKRIVRDGNNTQKVMMSSTLESSKNSKNSLSSINNDCENWLVLHGKKEEVSADVRELGKVVGLHYQCDTSNSFNLLSKKGRREWRAARGCEMGREIVGVTEGAVDE